MNFKLLFALFAACLLFAAGASQAAKVPKVDICHFDEEAGIFKPLAVPGNAVQPHLGHGDVLPDINNELPLPDLDEECMLIIPPAILAVAYIDVADNGAGYDPSVDLDIVTVLDSDATPGLSVGDTVEFGAYPTTLDPCPAPPSCTNVGAFTTNTTQEISVILDTNGRPDELEVSTTAGIRIFFLTNAPLEKVTILNQIPFTETVFEANDEISTLALFSEGTRVIADTTLTPIPLEGDSRPPVLTDDPFLDVEVY